MLITELQQIESVIYDKCSVVKGVKAETINVQNSINIHEEI